MASGTQNDKHFINPPEHHAYAIERKSDWVYSDIYLQRDSLYLVSFSASETSGSNYCVTVTGYMLGAHNSSNPIASLRAGTTNDNVYIGGTVVDGTVRVMYFVGENVTNADYIMIDKLTN